MSAPVRPARQGYWGIAIRQGPSPGLCCPSHQALLIFRATLNYKHAIIIPSTQARPHAAKNVFCIQNSPKEAPHPHSALIPGATFLSPPPCPPAEILFWTCPKLLQLRSPFLSFFIMIPRTSGLSQNPGSSQNFYISFPDSSIRRT